MINFGKYSLLVWGIIALAVLGITARAFCYQADVTDISGKKYFPAVKEALSKAKESIKVVMFSVETPLEGKSSKVSQLLDAIIAAKNRGAGKSLENTGPVTPISWDFLENPGLAPQMVKMSAERDFDVYLYLVWKNKIASSLAEPALSEVEGLAPRNDTDKGGAQNDGSRTVPFFYEDAAKYLGIYEGWTVTDYRRQIIRALRNLE